MEGQVTINLKDFDKLREDSNNLRLLRIALENKITNAVFDEDKESENVKVSITKKSLISLVKTTLQYDEKLDWVAYDCKDEDIIVEIVD